MQERSSGRCSVSPPPSQWPGTRRGLCWPSPVMTKMANTTAAGRLALSSSSGSPTTPDEAAAPTEATPACPRGWELSTDGARSWLISLPAWQGCDLGLSSVCPVLGSFINRQLCAGENGGIVAGPPSAASSLGCGGLVPKASCQRKSVTEGGC